MIGISSHGQLSIISVTKLRANSNSWCKDDLATTDSIPFGIMITDAETRKSIVLLEAPILESKLQTTPFSGEDDSNYEPEICHNNLEEYRNCSWKPESQVLLWLLSCEGRGQPRIHPLRGWCQAFYVIQHGRLLLKSATPQKVHWHGRQKSDGSLDGLPCLGLYHVYGSCMFFVFLCSFPLLVSYWSQVKTCLARQTTSHWKEAVGW